MKIGELIARDDLKVGIHFLEFNDQQRNICFDARNKWPQLYEQIPICYVDCYIRRVTITQFHKLQQLPTQRLATYVGWIQ